MSERRWTAAQKTAIDSKKKNIILSAAAGSGKTATLTERIIRLLKDREDPCLLSRMLIVTFTKAAAGELKGRIAEALSEAIADDPQNTHLANQLACLDSANISTIDSFFKSSISPFFNSLGLPPNFDIIDTAEASILMAEAMSDTVCDCFEGRTDIDYELLLYFADCLCDSRTQGDLASNLLDVADVLLAKNITDKDLEKNALQLISCKGDITKTDYFTPVKDYIGRLCDYYILALERICTEMAAEEKTKPYVEGAAEITDKLKRLRALASSATYTDLREFAKDLEFKDLTPLRGGQPDCYIEYKAVRTALFSEIKLLRAGFFSGDEASVFEAFELTAENIRILSRVMKIFREKYAALKRERGVADFADLSLFAKALFINEDGSPSPLAIETGKKFDYIFIDEYQDTNPVQDSIFNAISQGSRRFMVGDVKQSIYGFRGSRPELFTSYREKYEKDPEGEYIFMSENFRSDKCVLDFSNAVSEYVFAPGATPFAKEDRLICGKAGGDRATKCSVILISKKDGNNQPLPTEAETVAAEISRILAEDTLAGGERVRPGDIAILMRTSTNAEAFASAISSLGIPVNNQASEDFFNYSEVLLMLSLLNTADNPLRDIYLAASMKSPIFSFTLSELVRLRKNKDIPLWYSVLDYANNGSEAALAEKCGDFIKTVEAWREAAKDMTASEFLRFILADTGLNSYLGDGERGAEDIARTIKILSDHASRVTGGGGTLHELILHINAIIEKSDKQKGFADQNSVTIMTTHASKGLEFPVCIIVEGSKRFNHKDTQKKLLVDKKGRVAMKLYDKDGLVRCDTPLCYALKNQMTVEDTEEEARVLYVAMTRAREHLIISAKPTDPSARLSAASVRASYPLLPHAVLSQQTAADWIIDALARYSDANTFTYIRGENIKPVPYTGAKSEKTDKNAESFFEKSLDFSYDKEYLENIPSKLTVSRLRPDILGEGDEEKWELSEKRSPLAMENKAPLPDFLSGEKKAEGKEKGTATHLFMQFCDFENLKTMGAKAERDRLLAKRFISGEDAELVRLDEIELFIKSSLFADLVSSPLIYREQRFNTILPAKDLTTSPSLADKLAEDNVFVTVQGVVDCIYKDEDGKYHLVDYKTDRLTKEEMQNPSLAEKKLVERHKNQLTVYKKVCEEIIGEPFATVSVYSLPLGRSILIL